MSIVRRDDTCQNTLGTAIPGTKVYYLTQPANTDALTPLASIYSNTSGSPAANPQIADGFGHAVAYMNDGQLYTIVYVYPTGTKVIYPDQFVGASAGGVTPFAAVPSGVIDGTNRIFTINRVLNSATVWLNVPLIPGIGYTLVPGGPGMILTYAVAPQPTVGGSPGDNIYVQGY
jgi:hypothetical protein